MYSKEYKVIHHTKNLFGPLHISSTNFCPVNSNIPLSISSLYSLSTNPELWLFPNLLFSIAACALIKTLLSAGQISY